MASQNESRSEASRAVELPVACSLDAAEAGGRLARWQALFAATNPTIRRQPEEILVRVPARSGAGEELEALAAAERACCDFVRWRVTHHSQWHELSIDGSPEGIAAIAPMLLGGSPLQ
jgi:hypothetical protein